MRPLTVIAAMALGGLVTLLIAGTASARPKMWYVVKVESNQIGISEQAVGLTVAKYFRSAQFEPQHTPSPGLMRMVPIVCLVSIAPMKLRTGQIVGINVSFVSWRHAKHLPGFHTLSEYRGTSAYHPDDHDHLEEFLNDVLEGALQRLLPQLREIDRYPVLKDILKEMGGLP